jgi:hypothetical protein
MGDDLDAVERRPPAVNIDELKQHLELVKVPGMSRSSLPNIQIFNLLILLAHDRFLRRPAIFRRLWP